MKTSLIQLALFFLLAGCTQMNEKQEMNQLRIWFDEPATKWTEALPVGNGSLGGMIFGVPEKEKIVLNEETIWTGHKIYDRDKKDGSKYIGQVREYLFDGEYVEAEKLVKEKIMGERFPSGKHTNQMLANFFIESKGLGDVENYHRELDLNKSLVSVQYEKDGVGFHREIFSSYPDKVMVVKYGANKRESINFSAWVERTENTFIEIADQTIYFSEHVGNGDGVKFQSRIHFETIGGKIDVENGKLVVLNADEVIIRIVVGSDYRGGDPDHICSTILQQAKLKNYEQLKNEHIKDYQSLYKRVDLKLSENNGNDLTTDLRLENVKKGVADNYLTQLHFQYGRYLLISSSRPGSMPANLQGIWVDGFAPPWNADYHININIQMNYWLSEITNLSECHLPFLEFIGELREMGRITAKETYGCGGFVAHHTTDAWHFTSCFGSPQYGMWPMGAAWCCQHLFTHYEFTEDLNFLSEYAYPVMKEAAQFFVEYLVEHPETGLLYSGPSISPENAFLTKSGERSTMNMAPTMDREIIFELFRNCIEASEILNIDADFRSILEDKIQKIPPLKIGSDGRLMEWVEEFDEPEPGHRHISHLYALHPSNQITKSGTPELFKAAKKTIEYRLSKGGGHTGWSRAWIINFWARLLEAEKAYENIIALQQKSTLPNLFDTHPPFQIDGNFGVVSGIAEMLLQSHTDVIEILPALPKDWNSGYVKGLVARKGFELDIEWQDGVLKLLQIHSRFGHPLHINYKGKTMVYETVKGEIIELDSDLKKI